MAWTTIPQALINVGKAITQSLWQYVKDDLDYLYGQLGTISAGLQNGSFEIDSDSDGIPDSWTSSLYPGGSGGFETTSPAHGEKAYYFTHPGGVGNGGGYLTSDYLPCMPGDIVPLTFALKQTNASTRVTAVLKFYSAAKVTISLDQTVYDKQAAGPASWKEQFCFGIAPATAYFYKVELHGGVSNVNQAGTVYFDHVRGLPPTRENFRIREIREVFGDPAAFYTLGYSKWRLLAPGTGLKGVYTSGEEQGIYAHSSDNTVTGDVYCRMDGVFNLGLNSILTLRTQIYYNSNNYVKVGYWTNVTGLDAEPTNGIYFRRLATNNWIAVCRNGGVEAFIDTGVAYANDTVIEFRILRLTDRVLFYIDGVLTATITSSLPTATVDCINVGGYDAQSAEYCIARVQYCHYLAVLA